MDDYSFIKRRKDRPGWRGPRPRMGRQPRHRSLFRCSACGLLACWQGRGLLPALGAGAGACAGPGPQAQVHYSCCTPRACGVWSRGGRTYTSGSPVRHPRSLPRWWSIPFARCPSLTHKRDAFLRSSVSGADSRSANRGTPPIRSARFLSTFAFAIAAFTSALKSALCDRVWRSGGSPKTSASRFRDMRAAMFSRSESWSGVTM
jgi:hypothetical protein